MAYTWTNGELITAAKLNQTGGGGSGRIVSENDELDKTWNEISAMVTAGVLPFVDNGSGYYSVLLYLDNEENYRAFFGMYDPFEAQYFCDTYISSTADGTLVLD